MEKMLTGRAVDFGEHGTLDDSKNPSLKQLPKHMHVCAT